ncbi:MAG TPA: hypothetical protein VE439_07905 [Anaerolineae bacterium]|jgi:hypothetical protein|nr:hypothetical protein [Anaerolineae bacterium]
MSKIKILFTRKVWFLLTAKEQEKVPKARGFNMRDKTEQIMEAALRVF